MRHSAEICRRRKRSAVNQYKHLSQKWIYTRLLFCDSRMQPGGYQITSRRIRGNALAQLFLAVGAPVGVLFERWADGLDVDVIEIAERLICQVRDEHSGVHIPEASISRYIYDH